MDSIDYYCISNFQIDLFLSYRIFIPLADFNDSILNSTSLDTKDISW